MEQKSLYRAASGVRLLRLPEVMHRVGLGRSAIYAKIKCQEFPAPVRLGRRVLGWISDEIQGWIDARIATSRRYIQRGLDRS